MADNPLRALVYARESVYVAKDGTRSTGEQTQESLARCQHQGWEPITVDGRPALVDEGRGASRHSKGQRTGWERVCSILAGAEPGVPKPDVLVVWSSSRAQRDLEIYVELRGLCASNGVLLDWDGRTYNMDDGEDRFRTGLDALLAERDAEEIRKNVLRAMRANFAEGRPHGRILFGYRRVYDRETGRFDHQEPDPKTAPVVRRIFDEYTSGRNCVQIAEGLNEDGIPARTKGTRWTQSKVQDMLETVSYVGVRTRHGEEVAGSWPALITPETWNRAETRREAIRSTRRQTQRTARLLTGVARCGPCRDKGDAGRMHVTVQSNKQQRYYRCRDCLGTTRDMERLDKWATGRLLWRLARPDAMDALAGTEDPEVERAKERAEGLRAELADLMALWKQRDEHGNRMLSAASYAEMEADLRPQIAAAERAARSAVLPLDIEIPSADDLPRWWKEDLTSELRREIVAAFVREIIVWPVGRGKRNYDDGDYTEIHWRGE